MDARVVGADGVRREVLANPKVEGTANRTFGGPSLHPSSIACDHICHNLANSGGGGRTSLSKTMEEQGPTCTSPTSIMMGLENHQSPPTGCTW